MRSPQYYAVRGLGAALLVTAIYLLQRDASLSAGVEQAALAVSLLATGMVLGWSTYRTDAASDSDDRPFFDSSAAYVGFWAFHWVLFAVALGGFQADEVGEPLTTVVAPVPAAVSLVAVWVVAIARGGVNDAADPRNWVAQFRTGKRSADSE